MPGPSSGPALRIGGAGTIAKEDAGIAIGVVDQARHHIAADDQNVFARPASMKLLAVVSTLIKPVQALATSKAKARFAPR